MTTLYNVYSLIVIYEDVISNYSPSISNPGNLKSLGVSFDKGQKGDGFSTHLVQACCAQRPFSSAVFNLLAGNKAESQQCWGVWKEFFISCYSFRPRKNHLFLFSSFLARLFRAKNSLFYQYIYLKNICSALYSLFMCNGY